MKKAIVIGGGISGLCVSYFLKNKFELLLLEQNDYIGGHSHTHTIYENKYDPHQPLHLLCAAVCA